MFELMRLANNRSYFPQIRLDGLLEEFVCLHHEASVEWFCPSWTNARWSTRERQLVFMCSVPCSCGILTHHGVNSQNLSRLARVSASSLRGTLVCQDTQSGAAQGPF